MSTATDRAAELASELKVLPQALCRNTWTGVVSIVSADEARACLSGHDSRPLSTEYWCKSGNAMYRLMTAAELEAVARDLVN